MIFFPTSIPQSSNLSRKNCQFRPFEWLKKINFIDNASLFSLVHLGDKNFASPCKFSLQKPVNMHLGAYQSKIGLSYCFSWATNLADSFHLVHVKGISKIFCPKLHHFFKGKSVILHLLKASVRGLGDERSPAPAMRANP